MSRNVTRSLKQVLAGSIFTIATGIAAAVATHSAAAADFPTAKVNTTGLAVTDTEVTVGDLHSKTGTMAISETGSIQAETLAIEQINAMGGVLGRKIKVIYEDGASDWPTFAEKSKKLLVNDKVAAVFGCWTSASRKAVLPIFEKRKWHALLPDFLRRFGAVEERNLHGARSDTTNSGGTRLGGEREKSEDIFSYRLRLHLAAHLEQDRP